MAPTATSPEPGVGYDGSIGSEKRDSLCGRDEFHNSKQECAYPDPEHNADAEEEEKSEPIRTDNECSPHVMNLGEVMVPKEVSNTEGEKSITENETDIVEDGNATKATANSQLDDNQLSPPPWPDVTYDQLVNYPKLSLRAQSYFDIKQIRAIKPVTLIIMGIAVPKFPELETNGIIKFAIRRTKYQLYHQADVLPTKCPKSHLLKEILRRSILPNLQGLGEDATHNDLPKAKFLRQAEGSSGIPTFLPRPGNYTISQCIDWLKGHPPPAEEHAFILASAKQWKQQVRDQMSKIDPKTKEIEEMLAGSDSTEGEEEESTAQAETATANTNINPSNGQIKVAFDNYTNHLNNSLFTNFNTQIAPPNVINYQHQIAAAVNTTNMQAQSMNHYQSQLAALQTQLAAASNRTQFEIYVAKDTFKFNASHFVAYPGFRERLHGHSYRASVKLLGSHQIGRDGYVLDFGCVKSATKEVCKKLNEYFLVPTLSEVLKITVEEDEDENGGVVGKKICGDCDTNAGQSEQKKTKKRKRKKYPGSVTIVCEDGSTFVFPRQDCLLLPIMHSTAEELAIYLYGKILSKLDAEYLRKRGVRVMEVTVSEAVGQDAVFRSAIPASGAEFDVSSFISNETIPVMPCATETEAAKQRE